jgi:ankyrin repeat protein
MEIMKKIGLSVLIMFGIIWVVDSSSGSPFNKEQDIDIDKHDAYGQTQLHRAVWSQDIEAAKILIDAKADVNIQAATSKKYKNTDYQGKTSLHFVVKINNVEAVTLLLAAKADKNIKDVFGKKALDYAQTQEMKELLR